MTIKRAITFNFQRQHVAAVAPVSAEVRARIAALIARMQTAAQRDAMDALFAATPDQIGAAAVEAARRSR